MKFSKKLISVILSITMLFSVFTVSFSVNAKEDITPVLFIPGIGQSQTYKYDDEGNQIASWNMLHLNTDFSKYSLTDWIAFLRVVSGLAVTIATQRDVISEKAFIDLFKVLMVDHLRDENGEFINNVVTPNYNYPVSEYTGDALRIFNNRIPCQGLIDEIGGENVYCYNYSIFSDVKENAEGLNDYIENVVLPQTGAKKVIIVPMSMGASVVNEYLNLFPNANRLEKVISVVGCWLGSNVFGDLLLTDFDENAPQKVYGEAINSMGLFGDNYVGSLVNIAVRILPKQEVDNILYDALSAFIKTLLIPNTTFLALCPYERYDEFAEKYLSDESLAETKAITDSYAEAQRNLKDRLLYQQNTYGTEFYFISGYDLQFGDCDYGFFKFFESYDTTNSDEVIDISSTAPGTSYVPAGTSFTDEYIADPAHHVSPDGSIDTATTYFENTTWFFKNQKHELTYNNSALSLAYEIALNKIKSVDDCADRYPQFNESRDIRELNRTYLPDAKSIDLSTVTEQQANDLINALNEAEKMVARTVNNSEEDDKIIEDLRQAIIVINNEQHLFENRHYFDNTMSAQTKVLNAVTALASKICLVIFGERGFSEFWTRFN